MPVTFHKPPKPLFPPDVMAMLQEVSTRIGRDEITSFHVTVIFETENGHIHHEAGACGFRLSVLHADDSTEIVLEYDNIGHDRTE